MTVAKKEERNDKPRILKNVSKREVLLYVAVIVLSTATIVFTYNNYFLYSRPILRIDTIENTYFDGGEEIRQEITGVIMNGEYKGKILTLSNTTSKSGVIDEQLHDGSELFIELHEDGVLVNDITGVKRDKFLVILLVLFIDLLILIGRKKGVKTLVTLVVNIAVSITVTLIYINNNCDFNLLLIFIPLALIFIILSLLICNGRSRKTLSAIISSVIALLVSFTLACIVLGIYDDSIYYGNIDYIDIIDDYKGMFYLNILLCGLGAIMDISITMASSIYELIERDGSISYKALLKSGKEISKDITGTMTNVMLFTCFMSAIPVILIACKNYLSISQAIEYFGQIEMIRVLTSCISIALAVPVSLYTSLFILRRCDK